MLHSGSWFSIELVVLGRWLDLILKVLFNLNNYMILSDVYHILRGMWRQNVQNVKILPSSFFEYSSKLLFISCFLLKFSGYH